MLVRVEFETETDDAARKKYNLIVKLLPENDSNRSAALDAKMDLIEINTYKYLLPDMIKEVPALEKYICPFHYGGIQEAGPGTKTSYASVLVLEDLRPLNYIVRMFTEDLTESEFNQGIDFMATFHFASKYLEHRKGATLPEIYPWFPKWLNSMDDLRKGELPNIFATFGESFVEIYKFLEQRNPVLIPHYKIVETRIKKMFLAVLLAAQKHPCGTHMDLWPHNLLVDSNHEKPVKIIDWQILGYTDPMIDFGIYIIYTMSIQSLNAAGISRALEIYFNRYKELCEEYNRPLERTLEEFRTFLMTYVMAFGMAWVPMFGPGFILEIPGAETKYLRVLELFVELGTTDFMVSITQ